MKYNQYGNNIKLCFSFSLDLGEAVKILNVHITLFIHQMKVNKLKLKPDEINVLLFVVERFSLPIESHLQFVGASKFIFVVKEGRNIILGMAVLCFRTERRNMICSMRGNICTTAGNILRQ